MKTSKGKDLLLVNEISFFPGTISTRSKNAQGPNRLSSMKKNLPKGLTETPIHR